MKEFVHEGRKLLATRQFQEAVRICRIGLLEDPASVEGRLVLAQALMSLARYDEVIAESRAALELREDSAPATVLLGEALFFKGAYPQARETLQRAAELDPDNASVQRLLAELDATAEVGFDGPLDDISESTRSYPKTDADPDVGDETEIQELPGALQDAGVEVPTDSEETAEEPESQPGPTQGAVEAAHKAAEDQERPDPVAGEVKTGTGKVSVEDSGPAAPQVKVDISKVHPAPGEDDKEPPAGEPQPPTGEPEAQPDAEGSGPAPAALKVGDDTIHTGEIASPGSDADATALAKKKPITPKRSEGSQSGARRWAERKWIGTDEAATREAVVVPSPNITTEEMQDSDLFGRSARTEEQKLSGAARSRPKGDEDAEDETRETKLSRPDPSGAKSRPAPASGRDSQPTASGKNRAADTPWGDDDDEETRPLRNLSSEGLGSQRSAGPGSSPAARRPLPPSPLAPPGAKKPFRGPAPKGRPAPGGAGLPGPGRPSPGGLPPPAGSPRPRPGGAGLPSPGLKRPGGLPATAGRRPALPPRPELSLYEGKDRFDSPELSGVKFSPPPAVPPAGVGSGKPIVPPRPAAPLGQPVAPRPTALAPTVPASPPSAVAPSPAAGPAPVALGTPVSTPSPAAATPAASATTAKPLEIRRGAKEAPRESTAPAARYPGKPWIVQNWQLAALIGAPLALIGLIVILVVAFSKDSESEAAKRHLKAAQAQVEIASYTSLQRADEKLLKVLQEKSGHKGAKSLRAFAAAVNAVEFGASTDRMEQMLDKGGLKDDDLLGATRILAALTSGDRKRARSEADKQRKRFPRSEFVAYARGLVQLYLGAADKALRTVDAMTARRGKTLLTRAKIRALLALKQHKDAERVLTAIKGDQAKAPWAKMLKMRLVMERTRSALTIKALDPAHSLVADATGRVSPRHKRWAQFLLAEGYGRLGKEADRQRYLAQALTGGAFRDPELAEAVAVHQLRHKAAADAQKVIQAVRRRYPERLVAVLLEAQVYLQQGKHKEVLRQLDTIPANRRTSEMNLLRARAALALGRYPRARQILTKLRQAYPSHTGVLVAWAKLLTHEGRLDEALTALEEVLKREKDNVEVIRDAARLELRRGKAADAVLRLEMAVRLRPRDAELRGEQVRAYLAAGRYKAAQTSIESALAAFPTEPSILAGKGQLMRILGKYKDALAAFDAALKAKPDLLDALVGRAEILLASGRFAKAEAAIKKVVKPAPELRRMLMGWFHLERWDRRQSDPHQANSLLSAASRQKGRVGFQAAVLLLHYYAKAMNRRGGELAYRDLSKRYGAHAELRSALALVRLDDDAYNRAKGPLNAALNDPGLSQLSPVVRAQVSARLAHAYWLGGNYHAARRYAKKALSIWPTCPRALCIRGIVAYELRNFSAARRYLKQAVEANPNLALTYYYLARTYMQYNQKRTGRNYLRKYLRLRPRGPLSKDARRAL